MQVKITKPDGTLFDGEASLVELPGSGGRFEVLRQHAPIIASLKAGTLRLVVDDGGEKRFDIRGGVVKGQNDQLLILVQ